MICYFPKNQKILNRKRIWPPLQFQVQHLCHYHIHLSWCKACYMLHHHNILIIIFAFIAIIIFVMIIIIILVIIVFT